MSKILKTFLMVAALGMAAAAYAALVTCPIDNMNMIFTGQTTTEMGKMLFQYRCPVGHTAWVVQ